MPIVRCLDSCEQRLCLGSFPQSSERAGTQRQRRVVRVAGSRLQTDRRRAPVIARGVVLACCVQNVTECKLQTGNDRGLGGTQHPASALETLNVGQQCFYLALRWIASFQLGNRRALRKRQPSQIDLPVQRGCVACQELFDVLDRMLDVEASGVARTLRNFDLCELESIEAGLGKPEHVA